MRRLFAGLGLTLAMAFSTPGSGAGTPEGQTPLIAAIRSGETAPALRMIADAAAVRERASDGSTALHWAVHRNETEWVARLLEAGADPVAANDYGATPMSEAAVVGNVAIIAQLLEAGADVDSPNVDGQTALQVLSLTGNVDAARLLVDRGADVNAPERWKGQTALMWASAESQTAMVELLVDSGADVDARSKHNLWDRQVSGEPRALYRPTGGLTPLLFASREGCLGCVRHLVDGGADVNLPDPDGITPLIVAVTNGHFDTAAYLVSAGADPNQWDRWGRTPLYEAVDLNTLPRGGRPDRPSMDQTTSLQMIEILLEAGANPNPQMKLLPPFRNVGADRGVDRMLGIGTTPLLRAAKGLDAPAIRLLLLHGVRHDIPNMDGITPVIAAAGLGSVDADTRGLFTTADVQERSIASLELLLAAGGDINGRSGDLRGGRSGQTPLHGAAFWGWDDVVRFLVDHGADLEAADSLGMTPVDSAMGRAGGNSRGGARIDVFPGTATLLERLGAKAGTPILVP